MNRIEAAHAALRAHALGFPEAYEEHPWGEIAVKAGGKVFLFLSREAPPLVLTVKLPASAGPALGLPFAEPTGFGLGPHGWVTARIGPDDDFSPLMLEAWVDESFRAVAPRRLVDLLSAREGTPRWS